ncbi:MAG: MarR family transcriptional regulator [Ilumatobacteraceae bacterium]
MERLGRQLYLTFRSVRERLDGDLASAGASVSQWILLKSAGDEPGLSQRQLADRVLLTGSTLTHHLDRLEADGYIARTRDLGDRRVVRVSLTAAGQGRRRQLDGVVESSDAVLRTLLSADEYDSLNALLAVLHRRVAAPVHGPTDERSRGRAG